MAVEPTILGDALTQLLRSAGVDDVIDLDRLGESSLDPVDGAVVTPGRAEQVASRVRLELPDDSGGSGQGRLWRGGREEVIDILDLRSVLEVLDAYCPAAGPRRSLIAFG